MDYHSMSNDAIAAELGSRIKARRLNANITQALLAEKSGLSLTTIKNIERGKGKLVSIIAVLRELFELDALTAFLPPVGESPLQLSRRQGKMRQRASGLFIRKQAKNGQLYFTLAPSGDEVDLFLEEVADGQEE